MITLLSCIWRQKYNALGACFWQNMNTEQFPSRSAQGHNSPLHTIFCTHFCFFCNHAASLSVFLSCKNKSLLWAEFKLHCHFNYSISLIPQFHTYTHPLLHPQHSPQGTIVTQREGSVTPALLLSATTPPSSSCFSSNQVLPAQIIQFPHPLHLVIPSSWPIRFAGFYIPAGGVKLLGNNEGEKERS